MKENQCGSCLFKGVCRNLVGCMNYTPGGDDAEYEAEQEYIEQRREQFYQEWRQYVPDEFD